MRWQGLGKWLTGPLGFPLPRGSAGWPLLCAQDSLACLELLPSALWCQCRNSSGGLQESWRRFCLPHRVERRCHSHSPPLVSRHLLHVATAWLPSPSVIRPWWISTASLGVSGNVGLCMAPHSAGLHSSEKNDVYTVCYSECIKCTFFTNTSCPFLEDPIDREAALLHRELHRMMS